MSKPFMFMGYKIEYWIDLQSRAESLDVVSLIEEIACLRKKISFYESRLDQMNIFRENNKE